MPSHALEASAGSPAEFTLRRTFKDSVFTNLFSEPRYAYEFYRTVHPEDHSSTVQDVRIVTVQNVLATTEHNDLGFIVGNTLMVLAEAQSTWSPNIALRSLLYAAQTIKNLIHEQHLNVYRTTPVRLPRPELYVVYTGQRKNVPATVTLSGTSFGGVPADIETTVRVISDAGTSLPGQYIDFVRTLDAQRIELGPNEHAIRAAVSDCLRRGVLTDYLAVHETEVVSIMMTLFDEEEFLRYHIEEVCREAVDKAVDEALAKAQVEARAKAQTEVRAEVQAEARDEAARALVEICCELGLAREQTAERLGTKLDLPAQEAQALVERHWPASS
jgi:hypothetical protein